MLTIVAEATTEPVSLADAKAHLRVIHAGDDAIIAALITAARAAVESETGRALAEASYSWEPENGRESEFPLRPVDITSADGVVPVTFNTKPGEVPSPLKAAILLLVADLYENTEASTKGLTENPTLARLIFPYRNLRV